MNWQYRHVYLLIALVVLSFGHPFFADLPVTEGLVEVIFFFVLVASIVTCSRTRREALIGIALGTTIMVFVFANIFVEPELFHYRASLVIVFFGYVFVLLMRQILDTRRVTADTIYGALSGYLLLGLIWAFAYGLLEGHAPGSYNLATTSSAENMLRFIGFSFVTLTTLGYGNISPMTPRADALAVMEAIVGQIYLAVLLARLVALNITQPPPEKPS